MCDRYSTVAKTNSTVGARGTALEGSVRFSDPLRSSVQAIPSPTARLSSLGAWIMSLTTTANSTLFEKTSLEDSESLTSYPPLGLLGAHPLGGAIPSDLPQFGPKPHRFIASLDVLHDGECPPPDRH
jgi:hypothetical protein